MSVVTADNPGYENAGMVTVDLAFEPIRKRLGPDMGIEWFTMHEPSVSRKRPHIRKHDLPFELRRLEHPNTSRDTGVFVGERTEVSSWLARFCEARMDVRLEWLPWSEAQPPPQLPVDVRPDLATLGDLLTALPQYRFIISDTYHLCVNAWRVGTPAVCIAAPQPGPTSHGILSLNDSKKHVFYAAYEAMDLYLATSLDAEEVSKQHVERIASFLENGEFQPVVARMYQHAERSREGLVGSLRSMMR